MLLTLLVAAAATPAEDAFAWLKEARGERFVYSVRGRRDPFLFRRKGPTFSFEPRFPKPKKVVLEDLNPDRLIERAEEALAKGEVREAERLAALSRRGLAEGRRPELARRIESVRKAAKILALRRRAEEEFARLSLTVDAICWSQDDPLAVISGVTRREGDVLEGEVQVYRIGKGEVVFLYKNSLKVRRRLGWSRP